MPNSKQEIETMPDTFFAVVSHVLLPQPDLSH